MSTITSSMSFSSFHRLRDLEINVFVEVLLKCLRKPMQSQADCLDWFQFITINVSHVTGAPPPR